MPVLLPSPPAKFQKRLLLAAAAGIALALVWRFWGGGTSSGPDAAGGRAPVRVAVARAQTVPHFLTGMGTVLPSSDVLVTSRVDGRLLRLHFADGQRVAAGDLLAEVDPRPFQASLEQAEGALARDQALLDNARKDLTRYARLAGSDFIAGQQYETQRALVRQYEGTVLAGKAAVDAARLQVEYSRITAPVSGRLGLRVVDEGNMIKSSDSGGIVRITELSPCEVVFSLPETRLPLVLAALREAAAHGDHGAGAAEGGKALLVQAWDREQKKLLAEGHLLTLDNQIDAATGTVRLKARFANADESLYPNQFVNARLLLRRVRDAVTVPSTAVQLGRRGFYVYVAAPDAGGGPVASLRVVTPGLEAGEVTVIDQGLAAGEQVVTDGLDRLRDGLGVSIAATLDTPAAEAAAP